MSADLGLQIANGHRQRCASPLHAQRRHRDRLYFFDFVTIPLIFEITPTFLAVFLFGFFFDFFVSRSVRAFAFSAVWLTTAASLPAVWPIVVAALPESADAADQSILFL